MKKTSSTSVFEVPMQICDANLRHRLEGSVLTTSLVVAGVFGFVLVGYLSLVGYQNKASARSTSWNTAIPIAEAGIEEALMQVNANGTNLVANNDWTLVDDKYFLKWRTIGEDRFLVGFFNSYPPVLVSQGFTRLPLSTNLISRTVVARTELAMLFSRGMVAKEKIQFSGNSISVDSFDSMDPNYSTAGRYDPAKNKDNGSVATLSSLPDMFHVGLAKIKGKIATGAGGVPQIAGNGSVGNDGWVDGGSTGIQPGAFSDDINVSFPDVEAPFTSALPPAGGTSGSLPDGSPAVYDYILSDGNWMISSPLNFRGKVLVTGNAVLYVTSDVAFSGADFIKIQPGASLKLYVSAPNATIGGSGMLNENGNAANFAYYGLPTNTKLSFSANAAFVGTIYAPQAEFSLGGGGKDIYDFAGASVTKTVTMNGHFNFHYDENLMRAGPIRGWVAISWDETLKTWADIRANGLGPTDL